MGIFFLESSPSPNLDVVLGSTENTYTDKSIIVIIEIIDTIPMIINFIFLRNILMAFPVGSYP